MLSTKTIGAGLSPPQAVSSGWPNSMLMKLVLPWRLQQRDALNALYGSVTWMGVSFVVVSTVPSCVNTSPDVVLLVLIQIGSAVSLDRQAFTPSAACEGKMRSICMKLLAWKFEFVKLGLSPWT